MDISLQRILSLIPKKPDGKYVHGEKKKFCERIGAPVNIISEWESGKTQSYRSYLYAISAKYGVSVEWLKGETDEKTPRSKTEAIGPKKQELIDIVKDLNEEEVDSVLEIVRSTIKILKRK